MEDLEIKYYFYITYGISGVRIEIHEGALKITDWQYVSSVYSL